MIITIDYNGDEITIQNAENDPAVITFSYSRNYAGMRATQSLLEELFNMLEPIISSPNGVILQKIDEDQRTTIGEW